MAEEVLRQVIGELRDMGMAAAALVVALRAQQAGVDVVPTAEKDTDV